MSDILRTVLDAPAATWIAVASLAVSITALVISNRRRIFDQKLLGEKKATELKSLSFEFLRQMKDLRRECDNLKKICSNCEKYPEHNFKYYHDVVDDLTENENTILKNIDKITAKYNVDAAIVLESYTAPFDDIRKQIESLIQEFRKLACECPEKKQEDSSEQLG